MCLRRITLRTLVRRELQRPPDQRPPTYEPDLFRARFTLLWRADHLSDAHQAHLNLLIGAHPRLRTAWDGSPISTPPARSPNTEMEFPPLAGHFHKERVWSPTMGLRAGKESCWEGSDREEGSRMSSNETR